MRIPAHPSRRQVLAVGTAVATVTVAGCGSSTSTGSAGPTAGSTATGDPGSSGAELASLAGIPVGGCIAAKGADGKPIIIAQPTQGTAVAFSAICTHLGCTVAPSSGRNLKCPCHGSAFDATTGAVVNGPAAKPLPAVAVHVAGGSVVAGSA